MNAIIWKELREHVKWAVLVMLALGAIVAFLLLDLANRRGPTQESLLDGRMQTVFGGGSILLAALLGFLQTGTELRRDRWAFLIHRPLTPTRIFLGKVVAAMLLYFPAIGLPLLAAVIWVAIPEHLPVPFTWRIILPGVADMLAGIVFYFAAMLVMMRQARWYGSRVLPLVSACFGIIFTLIMPRFGLAIMPVLVLMTVMGVAAWGSFIAGGQHRSQPRVAKFALGSMLVVGIATIGTICFIIMLFTFEIGRAHTGTTWSSYSLDNFGMPVRTDSDGQGHRVVTNLKGERVADPNFASTTDVQPSWWYWSSSYRSRQSLFPYVYDWKSDIWFYAQGERLLVGYDRTTFQRIGSLGPSGFAPGDARPSELFPGDLCAFDRRSGLLIMFKSGVYDVSFDERRVYTLLSGSDQRPRACRLPIGVTSHRMGPAVVVTDRDVRVFRERSANPVIVPAARSSADYPFVTVVEAPDGSVNLMYQAAYERAPGEARRGNFFLSVSVDGKKVEEHDLPVLPVHVWRFRRLEFVGFFLCPIAEHLMMGVVMVLDRWTRFDHPLDLSTAWRYLTRPDGGSSALMLLASGALLCAGANFGIARRYAFTRRETCWWMLSGFFFGLAGVLTLLAMRDLPLRRPCPACKRLRIVSREHCEHCGAAFPPPAQRPTDIFDDASSQAVQTTPG